MKVTFDNIGDYLAELRACAERREQSGLSIVRATISRHEINAGVTAFRVVSGFHDNRYVYEATIDCGEHAKGGRDAPVDALDLAQGTVETIQKRCTELNVEFRAGTWATE